MWHLKDNIYYSKCECGKEIKSKRYYLSKHSGKCISCSHKKEPYRHLYNKLLNTGKHEKHLVELSFEEFINFTEIKNCHYCMNKIDWNEYCYKDGSYNKGAYYLDRKDNEKGYSKNNCVVCCTRCNMSRSNRYSYEEWYGMAAFFRKKEEIECVGGVCGV